MNNYNFSPQSPAPVNHSQEPFGIENGEVSDSDINGTHKLSKDSDKRSHSALIPDPNISSTSNGVSPSPTDSPRLSDSNQDEFLNNNYYSHGNSESNSGNDSLFEMSPDQLKVSRELELRKQQSDYEDDYEFGLNYDDVPEYDVRAKIQTLNAQLADEPLPPGGEHRNSRVVFREEIISLVIPPDNDNQSESEAEDPSYNTGVSGPSIEEIPSEPSQTSPTLLTEDTMPDQHKSVPNPVESEVIATEDSNIKDRESEHRSPEVFEGGSTTVESNLTTAEDRRTVVDDKAESNEVTEENDNMVVSRGGEFHVMGSEDIIDGSGHNYKNDDDKSSNEGEPKRLKTRPVSAAVSKRSSRNNGSNLDSGNSTKSDEFSRSSSLIQKQNDRSKLQIPRVDKEALRRQQERKKKEEEENAKREEEEQRMRKEMNTKSFNAWLQSKQKLRKEEDERKKKEEEEEREKKEKLQDERKVVAEEKEKELAKKLENEKRKEEKLRQYRLKEMEDSMIIHSEAECKKAFKDWLKKKHRDHQNKAKEDRQRARITRLAMRQCRKSQDLAQAIQQSSSFRYLDFCGYP